jgi:hypothetical protein|tara:strand:+ start:182 stop:523 length:342 start_codon:yes stop_codon:yes gene_type:complete
MNKLHLALIANFLASIIAFFQLQGHFVWDKSWLKSIWFIYFTSILIAPLYWYSTKWSYEHFGALWNMRLAGFGIGTLTFGLLTWLLIGEVPTLKTIICILLAASIILIQITNL